MVARDERWGGTKDASLTILRHARQALRKCGATDLVAHAVFVNGKAAQLRHLCV